MKEVPMHPRPYSPWVEVFECWWKLAEQTTKIKTAAFLHGLYLSSCLQVPTMTSFDDLLWSTKWNKSFSPHVALVGCYHNNRGVNWDRKKERKKTMLLIGGLRCNFFPLVYFLNLILIFNSFLYDVEISTYPKIKQNLWSFSSDVPSAKLQPGNATERPKTVGWCHTLIEPKISLW